MFLVVVLALTIITYLLELFLIGYFPSTTFKMDFVQSWNNLRANLNQVELELLARKVLLVSSFSKNKVLHYHSVSIYSIRHISNRFLLHVSDVEGVAKTLFDLENVVHCGLAWVQTSSLHYVLIAGVRTQSSPHSILFFNSRKDTCNWYSYLICQWLIDLPGKASYCNQ